MKYIVLVDDVTAAQSSAGKKMRLHILPQYHANLKQPIKYKERYIFAIFVPVLTKLCVLDLKILELTLRFYITRHLFRLKFYSNRQLFAFALER